jgi:DNA mismatch repair protein MutS2
MGIKKEVGAELDLHAMTVDEAIPLMLEYLGEAYLAGLKEVRIVHGKGTGVLKRAVNREIKKHPLVRSFRPGGKGEGMSGATVVEF